MSDLFDSIKKTLEFDKEVSKKEETGPAITFERDENGVLWSYDAKTGKKIGRIFEHGDDE